jgi:hypothetical protein
VRVDGVREPRLDLAVAHPAGAIALLDRGDRPTGGECTQQRARIGIEPPAERLSDSLDDEQ